MMKHKVHTHMYSQLMPNLLLYSFTHVDAFYFGKWEKRMISLFRVA